MNVITWYSVLHCGEKTALSSNEVYDHRPRITLYIELYFRLGVMTDFLSDKDQTLGDQQLKYTTVDLNGENRILIKHTKPVEPIGVR